MEDRPEKERDFKDEYQNCEAKAQSSVGLRSKILSGLSVQLLEYTATLGQWQQAQQRVTSLDVF